MKKIVRLIKVANLSLKKYMIMYVGCLCCAISYTCCAMYFPSIVGKVLDYGIATNNFTNVLTEAFWLLLFGGAMIVFQYLQKLSFAKLSQSITINIQSRLMEKITRTNYQFWKKHKAGDVQAIIEKDVNKLEVVLTSTVNDAIISAFVAVGVAIYLIHIDFLMGIIITTLALLFALAQKKVGNRAKFEMTKLRNIMGNMMTYTNHVVNNVLSIRMFGAVKKICRDHNILINEYRKQYIKQIKVMNIVQSAGMAFNAIGLFIIMIMGARKVFVNELSVGMLFSLTLYLQRLYNPIVSLGNLYVTMKSITPVFDKILDILENRDEIICGIYSPEKNLHGKITINNMKFKYEDNREYVFNNFNMNILPGEIVGIIGKNGSGKTSLIRLLSRICSVNDGQILLDDIDCELYDDEYLFDNIGIMSQENYLPDWSLKEILQCDESQVEKAESIMKYLDFPIDKFPNGLNSKIGENKISLSGGEIQKIAFIRLLLQDKRIFIMDEPTSALDLDSEKRVIELIESMLSEKTCIIITHRKPLLEICNKIIEL